MLPDGAKTKPVSLLRHLRLRCSRNPRSGRRFPATSPHLWRARVALAGSLRESLDTEDEDAEAAWATEVNRRVAELDSRAVKTIPWADVHQE